MQSKLWRILRKEHVPDAYNVCEFTSIHTHTHTQIELQTEQPPSARMSYGWKICIMDVLVVGVYEKKGERERTREHEGERGSTRERWRGEEANMNE